MHGDTSFIGEKIKQLRKGRGMTLLELSEYTGLSTGHLSQIERGKTVPNIEHLMSIAENLSTTVAELIDGGVTEQNIIRKDHAVKREYPDTNMTVTHYVFASEPTDFQIITISPGEIGDQPWSRHKYPEATIVLSGTLTALLGDQRFVLNAGDALYIPAGVRHKLLNEANVDCISSWSYLKR